MRRKERKYAVRTFDTERAKKLINQIDDQVGHIDALGVIPLIAPANRQRRHTSKRDKHTLVTSNHEAILVVLGLTNTIELVVLDGGSSQGVGVVFLVLLRLWADGAAGHDGCGTRTRRGGRRRGALS
jgi:hypothetical protein